MKKMSFLNNLYKKKKLQFVEPSENVKIAYLLGRIYRYPASDSPAFQGGFAFFAVCAFACLICH